MRAILVISLALFACGVLFPAVEATGEESQQEPDGRYGFTEQPAIDLPERSRPGQKESERIEREPFRRAARRYFGLVRFLRLDRETLRERGLTRGSPWSERRRKAALQVDLGPFEQAYRSIIDEETTFVLIGSRFARSRRSSGPRRMDTLAAVDQGRLYPLYVSPSRLIDGFLRSPRGDEIAIVRFERPNFGGRQSNRYIEKVHLELLDLETMTVTHTVVSTFENNQWVKLTWSPDSERLFLRGSKLTDVRCEVSTLECGQVDSGATPETMVQLLNRKRPGIHATLNTAFYLDAVPASLWRRLQFQRVAGQFNPETIRVGPKGKWVAYESFQSELQEASAHWWHGKLKTKLWVLNRESGERRLVTEARDFSHTRWLQKASGQVRLLYDAERAPTDKYEAAVRREVERVADPREDEETQFWARRRAIRRANRKFDGRRWKLRVLAYHPESGKEEPWLEEPFVRLLAQETYAGQLPETRN